MSGPRSRRSLYGMLSASSLSIAGTRISAMALPWLVLTETDSPTLTGLVVAFEMAPYIASKALAGPLVDSVGPRRVSLTTDVLSGCLIAVVPLLYAAGQLELPDRMPVLLTIVAHVGVVVGRVGPLADSLAWAGIPLGGVAGGAGIAALGLTPALAVAGGAYFLTTTLAGMRPEWRQMDRARTERTAVGGR